MKKLWSFFTQTVTVVVAVLFVIMTFKPEWLGKPRSGTLVIQEATPSIPAVDGADRPVASYRYAAGKALPAVVHVYTTQNISRSQHPLMNDPLFRHFFGDQIDRSPVQQRRSGLGSGVIVSANGYVLTNFHVIESADGIEVALNDGGIHKARIVGTDPESDLAVLQIEARNGEELKLPVITFGQMDSVRVGDVVLAIGNPFGVGQTVTLGIVSALGRSHLGINTFEDFIQTDAAINLGNSGGALIDDQGNLIGINSAIYSRSGGSLGIGFAIPVSTAREVLQQIIEHGSVIRGWIGIETQDLTPELAEAFGLKNTEGVMIAGLLNEGPAARAGMRPGDVILKIGEAPTQERQIMLNQIAALRPDASVNFHIRRGESELDIPVKIGKRPLVKRAPFR